MWDFKGLIITLLFLLISFCLTFLMQQFSSINFTPFTRNLFIFIVSATGIAILLKYKITSDEN